ncbi:MAG TPA: hypothetical protein PLI09_12585 [Candidatus Hydrogenedentes bacterium]|nr:hypothetical protein [Candidatus Hydrogenedentota bacterium]
MRANVIFWPVILIICLSAGAFAQENPCNIVVSRDLPAMYIPGGTVEVELTLSGGESCEILALGTYEAIPDGWTFVSMSPISGTAPQVYPAEGDSDLLEFAWFTIPALPCTFSYVLNIPWDAHGEETFTGNAEYRLLGGPLMSEETVSTIAGPETEGQGEGEAWGEAEGQGEGEAGGVGEGQGEGESGDEGEDEEDGAGVNMQFVRELSVERYTPGQPLDVTITISVSTAAGLTAVGFYESLPSGWVFNGLRGITGEPPIIAPAPGDMGVLEFAWIQIPGFPYTFGYTVTPPESSGGLASIWGQTEYRTNGGALKSPVVISEISAVEEQTEGEGEEGEGEVGEGEGEGDNPSGISLDQQIEAEEYTPGEALEVVITIDTETPQGLRALGLYQTLPTGWVFNGMRAISGDLPLVAPEPGAMNYLEFAWIAMPNFPYVFAYTVTPAEDACAHVQIHGRIEYRTNGPAYFTLIVVTRIAGPGCEPPRVMYPIARVLYRHFNCADANDDGYLSFHEACEIIPGLTAGQFAQLDVDQDVQLSPLELSTYLCEHGPAHGCLGGDSVLITLWDTVKEYLGDLVVFILFIFSLIVGYRLV